MRPSPPPSAARQPGSRARSSAAAAQPVLTQDDRAAPRNSASMSKETMTGRERWLAVLNGEKPDRIPMDYWATGEASQKLCEHMGCDLETALARLHVDHPASVGGRYVGPPPPEGQDIWASSGGRSAMAQVCSEVVGDPPWRARQLQEIGPATVAFARRLGLLAPARGGAGPARQACARRRPSRSALQAASRRGAAFWTSSRTRRSSTTASAAFSISVSGTLRVF